MPTEFSMTVFSMDAPTPQGSQVACSWCDFATRPLVNHYVFRSFKLHLYVRWPTQCAHFSIYPTAIPKQAYVSLGIGSASSDLSKIFGYQYRDYSYPVTEWSTVLDLTLAGYDANVGKEVRVAIDSGKRLVVHLGVSPPFSGNDTLCLCDQLCLTSEGAMAFPTILFGDAEHASYIETDAVELQGQPIPEFPLPVLVLLLSLIVTYAISTRRKKRL